MNKRMDCITPSDAPALTVDDILNDFSASSWIKDALRAALTRDPIDAANDAELLAQILAARSDATLKAGS